jgi:DNA modification methylase
VKKVKLNHIYQGDCVDVMRTFPEGVIDLTVTSPPYDNLRTYNGNIKHWSFEKFKAIAKELYRVTKQGGVVVWVVADATIKGSETGTSFKQALYFKEIGFNLHDTMIWQKKNPIPNDPRQKRYIQGFEYMFVFSKGSPFVCNYRLEKCKMGGMVAGTGTARKPNGEIRTDRKTKRKGKKVKDVKPRTNIWLYSNGGICREHPASFPEQLAEDHILSWSNPGDIVLDPMCGSGTTCKMAKLNGRNYIGIDIAEEYVELARRRVEEVS